MTLLQALTDQLLYLVDRIEEEDCKHSNDDTECEVIEGKLSAYRDLARKVHDQIGKAI